MHWQPDCLATGLKQTPANWHPPLPCSLAGHMGLSPSKGLGCVQIQQLDPALLPLILGRCGLAARELVLTMFNHIGRQLPGCRPQPVRCAASLYLLAQLLAVPHWVVPPSPRAASPNPLVFSFGPCVAHAQCCHHVYTEDSARGLDSLRPHLPRQDAPHHHAGPVQPRVLLVRPHLPAPHGPSSSATPAANASTCQDQALKDSSMLHTRPLLVSWCPVFTVHEPASTRPLS
jgi:hypothetical protein